MDEEHHLRGIPLSSLRVMPDADLTLGEVGRRVEDLERITSRLSETVIRMQAVADVTATSKARWWALSVGVMAAVAGDVAAMVVALVH